MEKKDQHLLILEELYKVYQDEGINDEFIWDGPSNWVKYENSKPRIVFLAKEAHDSFHPSNHTQIHDRFTKIIAKWAFLIRSSLLNNTKTITGTTEELQEAFDSIAIVEIKKIDGRSSSTDSDLKKFTWLGQKYLQKQLETLAPHIVVCLGTLEYYDIINNYSNDEKKIYEKGIYAGNNRKCWLSKDQIVIQMYHPSYISKPEEELLSLMQEIIQDNTIQMELARLIHI